MSGNRPKINRTLIKNSEPREKRYFVWDNDPLGFGLVVQPTGTKAYVFQYRTPEGRTRRGTLGSTEKLTPDQARAKAKEWSAIAHEGGDPLDEKRERRNELTVAELLDAYAGSEAFKEKARSTRETDKGRIKNHLKPLLGRKFARKLTPEEVRKARTDITNGKTARDEKTGWRARSIVKGGKGAARQSLRLLSAAFSWGVEAGKVSINPVANVKTGGDGSRDIIMRDGDDYRRLFETLDRMENEKRLRQPVADAIRLIALTGARRDEIAGLEWREVDLDKGVITIPPERHKTGRRTNSDRIIGLPALAREILARQPEGTGEDLVFPPIKKDAAGRAYPGSRKGAAPRINLTDPWRRIRMEAELPGGIGLHGLRHSLASHMALQGAEAAALMTALGHKNLSTSQKYIHWAQDARADLAENAAATAIKAFNLSEKQHDR